MLGDARAPYFGLNLEYPHEARSIWEGHRGIEEYAREIFPTEESNNGLTWMDDGNWTAPATPSENGGDSHVSRGSTRPTTPAGGQPPPQAITGAYTPRSHPEGLHGDFFVGSC